MISVSVALQCISFRSLSSEAYRNAETLKRRNAKTPNRSSSIGRTFPALPRRGRSVDPGRKSFHKSKKIEPIRMFLTIIFEGDCISNFAFRYGLRPTQCSAFIDLGSFFDDFRFGRSSMHFVSVVE
jgi:hypothetical protein